MVNDKTLLDIVQDILRSVRGQPINSIFDTEEATDIAYAVRESYDNILLNSDSISDRSLFELTSFGPNKPTMMSLPANASGIDWVRYSCKESLDSTRPSYKEMKYLSLPDFLELTNNVGEDLPWFTEVINNSAIEIFYRTDKNPDYYTTLDDNKILFDSFDNTLETNLQNNNTMAFGLISVDFLMEDSFIIPLRKESHQLLLQEAKAQVFIEQQQMENGKAERRARQLKIRSLKHGDKIPRIGYHNDPNLPNYGKN